LNARIRHFSLLQSAQTRSGAHLSFYLANATGNAAGREEDHTSPCGAEVKNAWSCTSIPSHPFPRRVKGRTLVIFILLSSTYKLQVSRMTVSINALVVFSAFPNKLSRQVLQLIS